MSDERSLQELIRGIMVKLFPALVFGGVHSYVVATDHGDGALSLAPTARVLHGPRLRVEQWAGPGIEAGLSVGDKLLLVFVDNDAAQPAIIGHMPLRQGKPGSLKIDATGTIRIGASAALVHFGSGTEAVALGAEAIGRRVVCYGDQIQVPVSGVVAQGPITQNAITAPNQIAKVRG